MLRSLTNFIDYEDVEPGVGPVRRIPFTVEYLHADKLDLFNFVEHVYSFIEHQIQLEDSLWQIMTKPVEFSMLNIDKTSRIVFDEHH